MKFKDWKEPLTYYVYFYVGDQYIGYRIDGVWGLGPTRGKISPSDVEDAEIVKHYRDERDRDTFVLDLKL